MSEDEGDDYGRLADGYCRLEQEVARLESVLSHLRSKETQENVQIAIADMEEAQSTHSEWFEYLKANPDESDKPSGQTLESLVAPAGDHAIWVGKYNRVLDLLRLLLPDGGEND